MFSYIWGRFTIIMVTSAGGRIIKIMLTKIEGQITIIIFTSFQWGPVHHNNVHFCWVRWGSTYYNNAHFSWGPINHNDADFVITKLRAHENCHMNSQPLIDQFVVPTAHALKKTSRVKQLCMAIEFACMCRAKLQFYSKLIEIPKNLANTWMYTYNV